MESPDTFASSAQKHGRRSARRQQSRPPEAPRQSRPVAEAVGDFTSTMSRGGFRFTKQRREVYDALLCQRDHPTATDLFLRVKDRLPHISLATIYNCLETLIETGLVKQVTVERGPSRYCPNLTDHGHFHCTACGTVIDVPIPAGDRFVAGLGLPNGAVVTRHDITLHGLCQTCSGSRKPRRHSPASFSPKL